MLSSNYVGRSKMNGRSSLILKRRSKHKMILSDIIQNEKFLFIFCEACPTKRFGRVKPRS